MARSLDRWVHLEELHGSMRCADLLVALLFDGVSWLIRSDDAFAVPHP